MNAIKDARLSRKLAATATRSVALLGLGLGLLVFTGGQAAWAHQDPPGCSGSGVDFKFEAFRSDGSVLDGFHPSECETITYQIKIAKSNIGTPCAFEGGTMTIKTPDGVSHNVTPGGGVPCTGGTGACTAGVTASMIVSYTVNPADVFAVFFISATGSYTAAFSHTGTTDTLNTPTVSIDLVNHVDFCPADTPCRDNFCNPALYDSATGALGNCTFTNAQDSSTCPETDGDKCTTAGCDGFGSCDQNHIVKVCPPDGNPCTSDLGCDSATGACVYTNKDNSSTCPETDGNKCTMAGCDGFGSCDQHHIVMVCPPELPDDCTISLGCDSTTGACVFTPVANSMPCLPDTSPGNNCTAGCNGFNVCDQNHICTVTTTTSTSTSTTSSTTTTTAPCVPTGPEAGNCNDMIDNDCDGKIDCTDPDCGPTVCHQGTQAGLDCSTDASILACVQGGGTCECPQIHKDPTTITFHKPPKTLDRLKSHGRVTIIGSVNVGGSDAGWLLDNSRGRIYGVVLPAGSMTANTSGTLFSYKNIAAKTSGGIYVAKIRFKAGNVNHTPSYTYSLETYGDMSAATDANMAIQFYIGNLATPAIHSEVWTRTTSGWKATGN